MRATLPELPWAAPSEGATQSAGGSARPRRGPLRSASPACSPPSQAGRLASTRSPLHPASPTADHEPPHEQLPPHPGTRRERPTGCLALRRCACALRTAVGSPADSRGDAVGAQRDAEYGSDDPQDSHCLSPPSRCPEPRDFDARTGRDEPDSGAAVTAWPKAPPSKGRLAAERPPHRRSTWGTVVVRADRRAG